MSRVSFMVDFSPNSLL